MFSLLKFADVILVKKWNLIVAIRQYVCFIFVISMRQKQTFLAVNMFNLENVTLASIQLDLCDRQRSLIAVLSHVLCELLCHVLRILLCALLECYLSSTSHHNHIVTFGLNYLRHFDLCSLMLYD